MNPLTNLLKKSEVRGHQVTIDFSDLCDVVEGMQNEIEEYEGYLTYIMNLLMVSIFVHSKKTNKNDNE